MKSQKGSVTKFKRIELRKLPSFLQNVGLRPERVVLPKKQTSNENYQGLLFFGVGPQHHPSPRIVNAKTCQQTSNKGPLLGSDFYNIILKSEEIEKKRKKKDIKPTKFYRPAKPKRCVPYIDPYPHTSPGVRRAFVPDVCPTIVDLGETPSLIVDETVLEIPVRRIRRSSSGSFEEEEIVMMSDLWEKRRVNLSLNERRAHGHFFKKFALVRVIGPTVPASIITTQLPTKRKPIPDVQVFLESEAEARAAAEEAAENLLKKGEAEEEASTMEEEEEYEETEEDEEGLGSEMDEDFESIETEEEEEENVIYDGASNFAFEADYYGIAGSDWQLRYEEAEKKREEERMREEEEMREQEEMLKEEEKKGEIIEGLGIAEEEEIEEESVKEEEKGKENGKENGKGNVEEEDDVLSGLRFFSQSKLNLP